MIRTSRSAVAITSSSASPQAPVAHCPHQTLRHGGLPVHTSPALDFAAFAGSLRQEFAPTGLLDRLLVDRLILSAWNLQTAVLAETTAALQDGATYLVPAEALRDTDRHERCLEKSLDLLQKLRGRPSFYQGFPSLDPCPAQSDGFEDGDASNEWPVVPSFEPEPSHLSDNEEPCQRWEDRLVFDFNVSESSPVVKGTWITVSQVVSMIVDGWSWSDILRSHPELTEEDIRTCLAYVVEQDNGDESL